MTANILKKYAILEAEDVADSICYVISVPQRVNITELMIEPTATKKML